MTKIKEPVINEANRLRYLKYEAEKNFILFVMMMFKEHTGMKFIPYPHIMKIVAVLHAVADGRLRRVVINIAPRYGKTEIVVKMFIAWGLALNPRARFIHVSGSAELAMDNSAMAKEYIQSEHYQKIWPMELKFDQQSKHKWFNKLGGGCYATSIGGQITGFGAGTRTSRKDIDLELGDDGKPINPFKGFSGAILIDDANKPEDSFSESKREGVNKSYTSTVKSRVNNPKETPIILIQQRTHENDLSGFLLNGGSGEKWYHLNLPVLDKDNNPLCEAIHSFKQIEIIRKSDRYNFASQYMQTPTPDEGGVWLRDWFKIIKPAEAPPIERWRLYIDGAYTKKKKNDPSGLMLSAKHGKNLYILTASSKFLEFPELIKHIPIFIRANNADVDLIRIEPKASGLSIAQELRDKTKFNVTEIRGKAVRESKFERASRVSPYIEGGRTFLIDGSWVEGFLHQVTIFPNGLHDEYVDLVSYAINDELVGNNKQRIIW